jgi:hypothetical protein
MNERIKLLALQAGAVNVWEWASDDVLDTKNMDAEKFAELIVRECIDTMYKRGEAYAHPSAGFYQAKTFAEAIMDYFGVKE